LIYDLWRAADRSCSWCIRMASARRLAQGGWIGGARWFCNLTVFDGETALCCNDSGKSEGPCESPEQDTSALPRTSDAAAWIETGQKLGGGSYRNRRCSDRDGIAISTRTAILAAAQQNSQGGEVVGIFTLGNTETACREPRLRVGVPAKLLRQYNTEIRDVYNPKHNTYGVRGQVFVRFNSILLSSIPECLREQAKEQSHAV